MTNIRKKGFRTVPTNSQKEFEKKLKEHRLKVIKRTAVIIMIVLAFIGIIWLYMSLRQYTDYEIRASAERADTKASKFEEFQENILKYSNDGAIYIDHYNERIWNQTYEMSNPTIDKCGNYLVIYDKKGKDIYILNETGLVHRMETNYPITQVSIASQGTIAILMDNQSRGLLYLYDKEGNLLVNGAIHGEKGGYPVAIALSEDAIKLGVSILDVKGGSVQSSVVFYNFSSAGENAIDHIVSINTYEDTFIPEVDFVSKDCMIAISDSGVLIFEGAQTPSETSRIELPEKINSLIYNNKYIGTVSDGTEELPGKIIRTYDLKGRMKMEENTELKYSNIEFLSSDEVCIYNEKVCDIYTANGIFKFHYEFEQEFYKVIPRGSGLNYTFILNGITEQVRLR